MFKHVLVSCSFLLLTGCVGSYIYHGEDQMDPFDDIHSVPPRPEEPHWDAYTQEEKHLQETYKSLKYQEPHP